MFMNQWSYFNLLITHPRAGFARFSSAN